MSLILDTATGARRPERGAARVSAPLLSEAGLVVEIALLPGASGGISVTSCAVGTQIRLTRLSGQSRCPGRRTQRTTYASAGHSAVAWRRRTSASTQ